MLRQSMLTELRRCSVREHHPPGWDGSATTMESRTARRTPGES
jgi:hypothetical protein